MSVFKRQKEDEYPNQKKGRGQNEMHDWNNYADKG